jgi:DNA-binding NarL/FixJ family response regulator
MVSLIIGFPFRRSNAQHGEWRIEMLRLITSGNANKEIAAQLNTTEETVKKPCKEHP